MKFKITIEAFDDEGISLGAKAGECDDSTPNRNIAQWFMETFISVKMQAICNPDNTIGGNNGKS